MDTLVLGLRVLLALACVIGLIWVLARRAGWGKGRRRPAGPAVEVVGRQALGRHAGVAVVAVGNRRLLLGYGEQNVTMLTELAPAPAEPVAPLTVADDDARTGSTPMTLGALAAAVLPTPRGPRTPKAARTRAVSRALTTSRTPEVSRTAPADEPAGAFEEALAAARASTVDTSPAAGAAPAEAARVERVEVPTTEAGGALHGSVLAPSTWKQAVAVLRERTVRR